MPRYAAVMKKRRGSHRRDCIEFYGARHSDEECIRQFRRIYFIGADAAPYSYYVEVFIVDIHFTAQDQEFIRNRENRIKIKQEEQSHLLEKSLRFFKAVTEDDVETVKQTTSDPKLLTMISVILSDRIRITEKSEKYKMAL